MTAALLMGIGEDVAEQQRQPMTQRRPSGAFLFDFRRQQTHQQPQQQKCHHQLATKALFTGGSLLRCKRRYAVTQANTHANGTDEAVASVAQTVEDASTTTTTSTSRELPEALWRRIGAHLGPLDRMRLSQCNKRLHGVLGTQWTDVRALEIRPGVASAASTTPAAEVSSLGSPLNSPRRRLCSASASASSLLSSLPFRRRVCAAKRRSSLPKECRDALRTHFRIRMTLSSGATHRIRTADSAELDPERLLKCMLAHVGGGALRELTIYDACVSDRLRASLLRVCSPGLHTLRLWNCSRYLTTDASADAAPSTLLLTALLGLPSLRQLLILDCTTPEQRSTDAASGGPVFSKALARAINAPLEELQLTACRLPLRALELLRERCGRSLRRLALGCVWGKERKRVLYLRELARFGTLADLDLPPFLFRLGDQPLPDPAVQQLLDQLPRLRALGFRHFNSCALFRFIERHLPERVRVLRVHHSAHRVPNFAELGHPPPPPVISPRPSCPSVRAGSILFGASSGSYASGTTTRAGFGSPESHRPTKKSSVGSELSCRSECISGAPQRSATISSGIAAYANAPRGVASSAASSCSVATTTSSSSSASSASSASPAGTPYRGKSLSLGADVGGNAKTAAEHTAEETSSMATSSTWCTLSTAADGTIARRSARETAVVPRESIVEHLSRRRLTIFAVAEERIGGMMERKRSKRGASGSRRASHLRKCTYAGVQVIYVPPPEALRSQEVLGRMGSPIQSPFVYTAVDKTAASGGAHASSHAVRVVRGDIVRAIPLSALGMESDYESEEEEESEGESEAEEEAESR